MSSGTVTVVAPATIGPNGRASRTVKPAASHPPEQRGEGVMTFSVTGAASTQGRLGIVSRLREPFRRFQLLYNLQIGPDRMKLRSNAHARLDLLPEFRQSRLAAGPSGMSFACLAFRSLPQSQGPNRRWLVALRSAYTNRPQSSRGCGPWTRSGAPESPPEALAAPGHSDTTPPGP